MNQRVSTVLVVALLLSAGATYLVYRLVASKASQAASPPSTEVVMAARNLDLGALVKETDLKTGPWVGTAPPGAVLRKDLVIGRGVIAPIYEGEVVLESRLAAPGAGGGLAATIPAGMRACAVRVNEIVGVAGFVVPGMRVDVIISGVPPGSGPAAGAQVKTLLQNIEVLSAGQNYQKDGEGKPVVVPVVNLLVTPEQAESLSLASNETRIQLVLRNPLDTQPAKTPGTAMSALFGGPKPPERPARPRVAPSRAAIAPPQPPPLAAISLPPYQIEVFNGAQRSEAKFPRANEEKK